MDLKNVLRKLGYYNRCPKCKEETASWSRLIGDIVFVSCFFFVLYFYFTVEAPYIRMVANCTPVCYKLCGQAYMPIMNFSNATGTTTTTIFGVSHLIIPE